MRHVCNTIVIATLLAVTSPAFAQDMSAVLDEFTLASWTDRDNLPSARIWGIEQDTDGYLWLGTDAGTFRFDGVKFAPLETLMTPPVPPERPGAILAARAGGLWLGYGGTGNIGRLKDGQLRLYTEREGAGSQVFALLETHDGETLAGTSAGLLRLRGERWERVDAGLPPGPILTVFEDRAHQLWAATRTTVLRRAPGADQFEQVGLAERSGFLNARFSEDAHGHVWMTDRHQGFRSVTVASRLPASVDGSGNAVMHDRRGHLWVATGGHGVWRVSATGASHEMAIERVTVKDGLLSDTVRAMHEDREGNIWIGTYSGLQRFSPRRVKALTSLGNARALAVTPDGSVWIAAATAFVRIAKDGTTREFGEADGLPGPTPLSLHTDRAGVLWAGTDRGVARLVGGRFVRVPAPDGIELARPMRITSSPAAVWIRDNDRGLFRWENHRLTSAQIRGSNTMLVDARGALWVGASGQVTIRMPNGEQRTQTLPIGDLTAMYEQRSDNTLWIGGSRGLTRVINDQFLSITRDNGFPAEVFAMVADETGTLWVAGPSGIIRLEQSEFEKAAVTPGYQLRYMLFDTSDGSAGVPTSAGGPNAVRAADGRLWFSTGNGLTIVDPRHLGSPRVPPRVRVEAVAANARPFDVASDLELPARTSYLQLEYTALTLTDPARVRFRYRLEGFDDHWIDAGTVRQATYTNLPPGDYHFRVMASNNDGRWNEQGAAALPFTILPTFYQTRTFYAACVIALGLLAWGAWAYRVAQVRRQFALVLAERIRMSRTIHDTLLQGMVGIALQFNDLSKTIEATPGAREQLARIRRQVEDYIREARSSIWDLRSPRLEQKSLADALREAGDRVTAGTPVRFELEVTGTPRDCSPKTAEQLLLIGQEAVSNAVRHAHATHVRMELAYENEHVRLRVSDDGQGFDIDVARRADGHYGLASMRERAEEVRGLFNVVSRPGAGTQIEAIVPTT